MTRDRFLSESPPLPFPARFERRFTAPSLRPVEHRLATAERELRIQFMRTAQLQAELDLLRAALRRSPDGARIRRA